MILESQIKRVLGDFNKVQEIPLAQYYSSMEKPATFFIMKSNMFSRGNNDRNIFQSRF